MLRRRCGKERKSMIGAIAGDIIGSPYEWSNIKTTEFPLFGAQSVFTDDTVLTVAVAECLLYDLDYTSRFKAYYDRYPRAGFGGAFKQWARSFETAPYGSYGNGSAMRVSPVAWAFETWDEVQAEARLSAAVTHDHPEGIRGAQAIAAAIFLARTGQEKGAIKQRIEETFAYDLNDTIDALRETYSFDVSCQGSVPQAIIAFLESESYEEAVRKAISIGGDSDTLACMAGSIAEAYYDGVPDVIQSEALAHLDAPMREVVNAFSERFLMDGRTAQL